jgi:hypothetical protein
MKTIPKCCIIGNTNYYHTTLEGTPGQLVFGNDMVLLPVVPLSFRMDWARFRQRKHDLIQQNNNRENNTRKCHTYTIWDMVGLDKPGLVTKLNILVHVNIRRLKPYHARAQPVQLGKRI